jgi:superfamily II DNA or RNA helicase
VHLIEHIRENNIEYIDNVLDLIPSMSLSLNENRACHLNYQREALSSWIGAKMSGCVVLLTGAGKTMIGLGAIYTWILLHWSLCQP